jgi:hypothetical protein
MIAMEQLLTSLPIAAAIVTAAWLLRPRASAGARADSLGSAGEPAPEREKWRLVEV